MVMNARECGGICGLPSHSTQAGSWKKGQWVKMLRFYSDFQIVGRRPMR
jgi:hypothetical protein